MEIGMSRSRKIWFCIAECSRKFELPESHYVYSKKGWVSFTPDKDAIVITAGDQIQAFGGGQLKHVIGRPIFKTDQTEDCISMAVLYSPPSIPSSSSSSSSITYIPEKGKTISLGQQFMIAIFLTLLYHFLVYVYKKF
ncbi:hypothetical protein CUMW_171520 [Citrus unshiu]|uniref:Uncharacterized protein n=1 Tax=Citrus unshiu TaxID=55188 RepID=A0A2H5PWE6_CITUN|nr:hypothetical protein CUMW_171520 [Citrus unshiu]